MKRNTLFIILVLLSFTQACKKDLNIAPLNIISDKDVFGSESGVTAYMARLYNDVPLEDFKYGPTVGFKATPIGSPFALTGEAISRDQQNSTETFDGWGSAYTLIRSCNYFLETLPIYQKNFSSDQINKWVGEARFVRAITYFGLVKRYGGVPIVDKLLTRPGEGIDDIVAKMDSLKIPRSAEADVYDFIAADLDSAYNRLPETNQAGRATKYAAAAFKSRAMLFAGSVAKYNNISLVSGSTRLCGISADRAVGYFKASYDAANLLNGKFSLYRKNWIAGDKNAQYQNFVNLFFDAASPENVFVRQFRYPELTHSYDANNIPRQLWAGGYSAETNPTLEFVEMFEGLPKNENGRLKTTDANGKYILYSSTMDIFADAEPRLRATVILPGDILKNESIEIRRGIYTGSNAGGISRLIPLASTNAYPASTVVSSATANQTAFTLPDGTKMNPAGLSGFFTDFRGAAGCISGFSVRKYLVPDKPTSEMQLNRSSQTWIEIRYAEVLLNRAEAAYELYAAGQSGSYLQTAITDINMIRERAGASTVTTINNIDTIRKERRKELAFENKTWWDLRRWRISDKEQNNTMYRILNAFYSVNDRKYFFDDRYDERNSIYTFDSRWYYSQIPTAVISRSTNLIQNPGY